MVQNQFIADNIKRLRTVRKMSQKQVALEIGIGQGQYSRIESGKVEPTLKTLGKIATVFEVSLAEIVKENNQLEEPVNIPLLEKIQLLDKLEKQEKDALMTIIDIAISKQNLKDNLSALVTA